MMILFSFILNPSLAKSIQESISVTYSDIKIVIDGIKIDPKDADGRTVEPFIYNGTTYLPVRAISESLGKQVGWDQDTKTVYIGLVPEKG
ncbi:MAG: copper amine oxidase N-terminal domain-containing protein, partial [Clostridiales bacterium]|nr:copper amine oxidase N-terminal domain-containing protein [Clostridiales bacterium]